MKNKVLLWSLLIVIIALTVFFLIGYIQQTKLILGGV